MGIIDWMIVELKHYYPMDFLACDVERFSPSYICINIYGNIFSLPILVARQSFTSDVTCYIQNHRDSLLVDGLRSLGT